MWINQQSTINKWLPVLILHFRVYINITWCYIYVVISWIPLKCENINSLEASLVALAMVVENCKEISELTLTIDKLHH